MVSRERLRLPALKRNLLNFYQKHKDQIFDIILFGSAVKGKEQVDDVDIAVIFIDKPNTGLLAQLRYVSTHIDYVCLTELYTQKLWSTLFREGYSVVKDCPVRSVLGVESYGLFIYDIRHLGSRKSRFSQVLKGYKSVSAVKRTQARILKPGVALVPIATVELFRTFLETWQAKYELRYVYV